MRYRVRIQPYVSPDLHRRLRAYSAANDVTDSAVAEAALGEYLDGDGVDEPMVLRRLDGVVEALAGIQGDVAVVAQALSAMARFLFLTAPAAPAPRSDEQVERLHRLFIELIADGLKGGGTLTTQVRRRMNRPQRPTSAKPAERGGSQR